MIRIVLHGTPIPKGRPRFSRATGHTYTPERTRKYEEALRRAGEKVMAGEPPMTGPLILELAVFRDIPKSWSKSKQQQARAGALRPLNVPDLDNHAKVVDALNKIVWVDDGQIVETHQTKAYSTEPRLVLTVTRIPDVFL